MSKHKNALFIFRRDLRLEDNTALLKALDECESVIPCFIFDGRQISSSNEYRGDPIVRFMIESLVELSDTLSSRGSQLYCFEGVAHEVIESIIKEQKIEAVYCNKDYTPFSHSRDSEIEKVCSKHHCQFYSSHDALLTIPGEVLTQGNTPYKVYSAFYKEAKKTAVSKPHKNNFKNFFEGTVKKSDTKLLKKYLPEALDQAAVQGGRKAALKILRNISTHENYKEDRDIPKLSATTNLSAHNKFGTVSIREVYYSVVEEFSVSHAMIGELYWRDFFHHVAFHYPHVFKKAFNEKYENITWSKSKKNFEKWCSGKTGFPIVDAGMRELNETGYMHNRVRMITASFLVKDLHLNWQWGERYFAERLVDYDPCVNNGNWQWAASTGCDAQPYFRIFNPWRQIERFDPDCEYIKKWVPELSNFSSKEIRSLEKKGTLPNLDYPEPIVDHREAAEEAKRLFGEQ